MYPYTQDIFLINNKRKKNFATALMYKGILLTFGLY